MSRLPIPVFLETVMDAPIEPLPADEVAEIAQRAREANDLAGQAVDRALDYAQKANEAQQRILAHNNACANLWPWQKPANWKKFGDSRGEYQGYCKRNQDNLLVPHGEGASVSAKGQIRCGQFENGLAGGMVVYRFSDGSVMAGLIQDAAGTGEYRMDNAEVSASFIGQWTASGGWMSLKLGAVVYPDGSIYHGYCEHVQSLNNSAPSGFGLWFDCNKSLIVLSYFEDGVAEGLALLHAPETPELAFEGEFSNGRLLRRAGRTGQ